MIHELYKIYFLFTGIILKKWLEETGKIACYCQSSAVICSAECGSQKADNQDQYNGENKNKL